MRPPIGCLGMTMIVTIALAINNMATATSDDPTSGGSVIARVIDEVEKECFKGPNYVYTIGPEKAKRLAELVRQAKPQTVVECGTAIGYSGLWIARELKANGKGRLITIEIDPKTAEKARANFRKASLDNIITSKVGDARQIVKELPGPIDFVFLDCEAPNYVPCLDGLEAKLSPNAIIVADNTGVSQGQSAKYIERVRSKYDSHVEWFDTTLPWTKRDAMEVTYCGAKPGAAAQQIDNVPPPGFVSLFNGKDLASWKIPQGDGGHWKIVDGTIDYDAQSQAQGDKGLWTMREFGDFVLRVDWRIKETPYVNPNIPYILPDGTHARDIKGNEMRMALPDSDSGIILRGDGKNQANIWCWPIGSGEFWGYRTDPKQSAAVRAAATPRTQADNPVGQWNRFEITMRGDRVTVVLNGRTVIETAQLPGVAAKGALGLQHHGAMQDGKWTSPPALLQFKNIFVKEL